MKTRTKLFCIAMAALIVAGARTAAAPAADQWYTSTTQTGTFTTVPVATNVPISGISGKSLLKVPAAGFTIECAADSFAGTLQNATTPVEAHITVASGMKFTGCQLEGASPMVCDVHSKGQASGSRIITLAAELKGHSNTITGAKKAHALFTPVAGGFFTEVEILGGECSVEQAAPAKVTGAVEGSVSPEGEVASQTETFTFPSTALGGSTLKYGVDPATFVSTETATVTSGQWVKLHL